MPWPEGRLAPAQCSTLPNGRLILSIPIGPLEATESDTPPKDAKATDIDSFACERATDINSRSRMESDLNINSFHGARGD
jgi:hypothetical protein